MSFRFSSLLACGLLALPLSLPAVAVHAASVADTQVAPMSRLREAIGRIASATDGRVGVAAMRVGGHEKLLFNAAERFPMASTFKIAVAATMLQRVIDGEFTLDQMIEVPPSMVVPSDGIAETAIHPGVSLSLHNLLELMLTRSDNTATDVLVAQAGGPAAVTAWLRKAGVADQRIDSDTARIIYRAFDITPGPGDFSTTFEAALDQHPELRKRLDENIPNPRFDADPRDTTTPSAMLALLTAIQEGKVLDAERTRVLLEIMERCHTGDARLKGLLPIGTPVAHKTGTIMGIANDVGIVSLPDGGKMAIAVYVKGDTKGIKTEERIIAEISRFAFDYFVMNGG